MVTTLLYRVALGFCLSMFNEVEEATIVCFFLGIIFFFYLFGDKPYEAAYHKWRTGVIQLCCLAGLGTAMYYRSMRSNTPIPVRTAILEPAYLVCFALLTSLLVSMAALGYELYLKFNKLKLCKASNTSNEPTQPSRAEITTFDKISDPNPRQMKLEKSSKLDQ